MEVGVGLRFCGVTQCRPGPCSRKTRGWGAGKRWWQGTNFSAAVVLDFGFTKKIGL